MSAKTYWNLLVLFCVLYQGIIGTLSEKDIDELSEILVRQKRVINSAPGGDIKEQIRNVPYIVFIKEARSHNICVGVILTQHIVLTVAKCVELDVTRYRVYSGTARMTLTGRYKAHNVTDKRPFFGNHPYRPADGVALITVNPPFVFSSNTKNIEFYEGNIHPGTLATVSGWGCNPIGNPGTAYPDHLRSITVPIISNHVCAALYQRHFVISELDICTLDPTGERYCGVGDVGAPVIIKVGFMSQLVGVHLFNGRISGHHNPHVFINLQNPIYKNWILENIHSLEVQAH